MILNPIKTQKIADSIYAVKTIISNFYIIDTGDGLAAFDTGMNPQLAAPGVKKLRLEPGHVTAVFLTHSDYDHSGGQRGSFRSLPVDPNRAYGNTERVKK